jgi:oxygen-independent coproporphyrinogen III oxidase
VAGIYISWPFCAQKCTYCNFASGVFPRELEARYLAALLREIAAHEWAWTAETVFIGGGTPSAMDDAALTRLLAALPHTTPGAALSISAYKRATHEFPSRDRKGATTSPAARIWREATLEAAPGTLNPNRVTAWQTAGINRVSLGVQSFIKSELARTGRRHDAQIAANDVRLLREHGIPNINIDLIAGLPGQTENSWRESLKAALRLEVPHISIYMLEVDDDSRLGAEILLGGKRYGASDVPSDDAIGNFYETAVEVLESQGIHRYEISNFARTGAESIHNLKYWKREPYIGFGADAHSFDGSSRWQNVESAHDYVNRSERGESVRCAETSPDPMEEKFFVGLRLSKGVHANEADWQRYGTTFEYFLSTGLLEQANGNLRLTPRGVMVSNEIFQEFLTV